MDPDKTNDAQVTGYVEDADNEEKFIEHLNKPLTMYSVYKAMFHDQLRGNGLQIFMLRDDANMMRYGNIICQYLSFNFGVDIIYLDVNDRRCQSMQNDSRFQASSRDRNDYMLNKKSENIFRTI